MRKNTIAAMLCAALSIPFSIPLSAQAQARAAPVAACPGAANWCDDFEAGTARWIAASGAAPKAGLEPGTSNHLLQAGDGAPLLVAAAESAGLTQAAYFVEARLRPSADAPAANSRRAILLARYVDERNWTGAAIGFAPGSKRLALELVAMVDGKLARLKQVGRSTEDGREAGKGFQTLRLELGTRLLSLYLNGELMTTAPAAFAPGGQAGVMAQGGDIDVDDVRIGAAGAGSAGAHPGRIALARMTSRLNLQAGDAPLRLAVSAFAGDGVTAMAFSASSSDPLVASASVDNGALLVRADRPGAAVITLVSSVDANAAASIAVTVGAAFAAPMQASVGPGRLAPGPRATGVPVDTRLHIRFDSVPVLGTGGSVRIFRTSDNALVDVIGPHDEVDTLGFDGQQWKRVVRTSLVRVKGAGVTIQPHNGRLAYGTDYYVAIDAGVFTGATVSGQPFAGIGRGAGWTFRTRAPVPARRTLTVDDDGPADFRTVQGALNHAMRTLPRAAPVTIRVANGDYEELLYLRGKDRVTLRGESRDGVVIHAVNNDGINPGSGLGQAALSPAATGGRSVLMVEDADLLTLDTLTLKNDSLRATSTGAQAEALYFNSAEGRMVATDASFLSEQDTVQVKGYSWFYRTLIAGNVDFIWGYNHAALFEESEIRSVGDSASPESGGYIVQARTVAANDPGFVFLNSRLTHGPGPAANDVPPGATWLARSPGTASTWDNVSYIDCRIDGHVNPLGWAGAGVQRQPAPNPATPGPESGWAESGSMDLAGRPLDLSTRAGGFLPTASQAKQRFGSRERLFQGFDGGKGWRPELPPSK